MRIPDGYSKRVIPVGKPRARTAAGVTATAAPVTLRGADTVDLSVRSAEVANARVLALQAPEVREPLLQEISGQIDRGEYQVSGADVAPALIQEHVQLSSLGRFPS